MLEVNETLWTGEPPLRGVGGYFQTSYQQTCPSGLNPICTYFVIQRVANVANGVGGLFYTDMNNDSVTSLSSSHMLRTIRIIV